MDVDGFGSISLAFDSFWWFSTIFDSFRQFSTIFDGTLHWVLLVSVDFCTDFDAFLPFRQISTKLVEFFHSNGKNSSNFSILMKTSTISAPSSKPPLEATARSQLKRQAKWKDQTLQKVANKMLYDRKDMAVINCSGTRYVRQFRSEKKIHDS